MRDRQRLYRDRICMNLNGRRKKTLFIPPQGNLRVTTANRDSKHSGKNIYSVSVIISKGVKKKQAVSSWQEQTALPKIREAKQLAALGTKGKATMTSVVRLAFLGFLINCYTLSFGFLFFWFFQLLYFSSKHFGRHFLKR